MNPPRRLTEDQVLSLPERLARGERLVDIAADMGVTRTCISGIVKGRTYKDFQPTLRPLIERALEERANPQTRTCTWCNRALPRNDTFFYPRRSRAGFSARCRQCEKKRTGRQHRTHKLKILRHYSKGEPACACCGEQHMEFLSIDHIDGGGTRHRAEMGMNLYRWIIRENYPDGFRVLCHNCNQALGAFGYCPHEEGKGNIYYDPIKSGPP